MNPTLAIELPLRFSVPQNASIRATIMPRGALLHFSEPVDLPLIFFTAVTLSPPHRFIFSPSTDRLVRGGLPARDPGSQ
jgi:hypothetical protein